jgi:hypothetical protein
MKSTSVALLAGVFAAAGLASSADAGVIYQSTPALNGGGTYWCSDCSGGFSYGFQALDPFKLGAAANVTGVDVVTYDSRARGFDGSAPFTVDVYTSRNDPSSLIFSQAVTTSVLTTGVDANNADFDVVHADLTGLNLAKGTQYWISFYAPHLAIGDSAGVNDRAILWSPPGSGTISVRTHDNLEYVLYGVGAGRGGVPEPASWAMMLIGLGALGTLARSRRRSLPLV